ncbi:class F sortase [Georgenia wangjunii]|uniref:class F sortase n=1 Tax=Georgenia wangjunii TaxID=3117730 RepID=UPI003D9C0B22
MPVDAVGVAADGQMEVPPDANRAGWYRFGPTVGEDAGTAVVVAHSGSHITPRGPLAELHLLVAGDRVRLTRTDGRVLTYEVTDVEVIDKATIDLTAYFRRDGEPRLALITCGGEWDEQAGSYRQNVVATATLLPDQASADAGA